MLGTPDYEIVSEEDKAEYVAQALKDALLLEPTEVNLDRVQRNARHLAIVLPKLNISATKRKEYEKLVADNLVE